MNSRQRAYLRKISAMEQPIVQIGKATITPEVTMTVGQALEARELIKISVLKNCTDDPKNIAEILSERTNSEIVHVIGRKIVLFRPAKNEKNRKILLP